MLTTAIELFRLSVYCLSLCGFIVFAARRIRAPVVAIPFFVTNTMILSLYVASLVGLLLPATIGTCATGILMMAYEVRRVLSRQGPSSAPGEAVDATTIGVVFVPLLLFWAVSRVLECSAWDEFSHWAFAVKEMCDTDALPSESTRLLFPHYTPGATLYRYYVCRVLGSTEPNMYFAHFAMLHFACLNFFQRVQWTRKMLALSGAFVACFAAFVWRDSFLHSSLMMHLGGWLAGTIIAYVCVKKHCEVRDVANVLPIAGILYCSSFMFYGHVSLYADSLLGIYLSAICAGCLLSNASSRVRLFLAVPALGALALVKDVGYLFAAFGSVLVLMIVLSRYVLRCLSLVRARQWQLVLARCRGEGKTIGLAVAVIVAPHLCYGLWSMHVANAHYPPYWNTRGYGPGVSRAIEEARCGRAAFSPEQVAVLQSFRRALLQTEIGQVKVANLGHVTAWVGQGLARWNGLLATGGGYGGRWSCWVWMLVLLAVGLGAALIQWKQGSAVKGATISAMYGAGFAMYLCFLLGTYLFLFPPAIAPELPSFPRYVAPFVGAWLLTSIGIVIGCLHRTETQKRAVAFLVATWLFVVLLTPAQAYRMDEAKTVPADRQAIRAEAALLKGNTHRGSRVFVVWQHSRGFQFYMAKYELYPLRTQKDEEGYSLCGSENENAGDYARRIVAPPDFGKVIEGYDYLMVGFADRPFWENYKGWFDNVTEHERQGLFEILHQECGVKLVRMDRCAGEREVALPHPGVAESTAARARHMGWDKGGARRP